MTDQKDQNPTQSVVNALNQISLAIGSQTKVIDTVFPTVIGTSLSAVSGSITPTNYVGFLSVMNPATGQTVKIGYYT